jgi:hypothetical protein
MPTKTKTDVASKQGHNSTDQQLSDGQLRQIIGGIIPSIPIPPPAPHAYARSV